MKKTTPTNCKLPTCPWNPIPPPENSQECISCDGNKHLSWRPAQEGKQP